MDFPLESIHSLAFKAAQAVECAGEQGRFWEMRDRLFQNQKTLDAWSAHAQAVGLDAARFDACLASGRQAAVVQRDMDQGQGAGASGAPWFFLGPTDPASSRLKTMTAIRGAVPFAAFKAEIDKLLEGGAAR
jgi:protein-disulfide isomerase